MTNFSLPSPQIASLYVTAGRSSLAEIKKRKVVLPAFLKEIDTKAPNTIMEQALVLLDGSLPPDGQTTGVGRLHLALKVTKLPSRTALHLRDCGTVTVKQNASYPFPFACCTRMHRTDKLTTVPPDTWVELYDDDTIQMGSSHTLKYRVMIPLSPILVPKTLLATKPHLLKLAFPGSLIARIIGRRGRVISHIKAKCTVLVIQLFLQNCAQSHEDRTYVLPHITLYRSTRHARSYCPSKNFVFKDQEFVSKN